MSCFARSQPDGEALDLAGLRVVYTGVRQAIFNAVLLKEPAVTTTDFRRRLDRAKDYFARREYPWSLWLCEDLLDSELRGPIRALIYDAGLAYSTSAPGMIIDRLGAPARAMPKLEYRRVEDATTRLDFCHVMSMSYEAPFATIMDSYGRAEFWSGHTNP